MSEEYMGLTMEFGPFLDKVKVKDAKPIRSTRKRRAIPSELYFFMTYAHATNVI